MHDAGHDAGEYGVHIAGEYDEIYADAFDTENAVETLVDLAAGGPVLELGIGTGRLALPLAARGLEVQGIDGSSEMLDHLRSKPGGEGIGTIVGDFSEVRLDPPGGFALVLLAVNTIYALPDQEAQVRCFATAAHHLAPGGRFVVEAWVPDFVGAATTLRPRRLSQGFVGLVIADHDPVAQRVETVQIVLRDRALPRVFPVVHRYAWPSELDLMARLSGLELEVRWADWNRAALRPDSPNHVSVYRKPVGNDGE